MRTSRREKAMTALMWLVAALLAACAQTTTAVSSPGDDDGTSAGAWEWTGSLPGGFPADVSVDGGAFIDSQTAGPGSVQDDDLESPLYELGGCSSAIVSYEHNLQLDETSSDVAEVYVLPGGAGTPVLLIAHTDDSPTSALESVALPVDSTQLDTETSFRIVFHYEGADDFGWYVDNVGVQGVP